jgi:hypothetical protein
MASSTALQPTKITCGDFVTEALKDCGAIGVGYTPTAEDITDGWMRLQELFAQWGMERWLVWHLKTYNIPSTGAQSYTVGPGGDFDTGANTGVNPQIAHSQRPDQIDSAFFRQINQPPPNQIDYPLRQIFSKEDYNLISLKSLQTFPDRFYYDPAWPLGVFYPYAVPQATIYQLFISIKEQMPLQFATQADVVIVPFVMHRAIRLNLALELMPKYGIRVKPGSLLPAQAKKALAVVRGAATQISRLGMPDGLPQSGQYNIFSDTYGPQR